MIRIKVIFILLILGLFLNQGYSQFSLGDNKVSYSNPKKYTIGGIVITGTQYLDKNVLISISGLRVGDMVTVPGDQISSALKNLWDQGLFADVKISASDIQGSTIFLEIYLEERPRLNSYVFPKMKKTEQDDLREVLDLFKNKIVNENVLLTTHNRVETYYVNKGYLNVEVDVKQVVDTSKINRVNLEIIANKKEKVKIDQINFIGVTAFSKAKLKRTMKEIKEKTWYDVFHTSKYIKESFKADQKAIIALYHSKGYRDVQIVSDSIYKTSESTIGINLKIDEGKQYYFRNIAWEGNVLYPDSLLDKVVKIKPGDTYDSDLLNSRIYVNGAGTDVSSLYLDRGYLFFSLNPVEVIEGDSIDYIMQIYEGKQAIINKVTVVGNTKTNDHVVMREIRTKPGQLFSYSDVMRTQRELAQLPYFNAEKLMVNPKPNPIDGTVDIEYTVEEQPSDQVEMSGGWGGGFVVGTLGLSFNNFSAKNIFKKDSWSPLPTGDGQSLSIRANSNGKWFQSYNFNFIEPWLGGKKPNALSFGIYHSRMNTTGSINITGSSIGLGRRLKFPDNFFTLQQSISYNYYEMTNYSLILQDLSSGYANNLNYTVALSRNSISHPIYPTSGSNITTTLQITPPYSNMKEMITGELISFSDLSAQERYKWIEFHKWKFQAEMYTPLTRKKNPLVLYTKVNFGFLASFNSRVGYSPFERFYIGGSGLTGVNNITGNEIIPLRGYPDFQSWGTDANNQSVGGGVAAAKYTAEIRFPFSLNPSATVFGLAFVEAGNNFTDIKNFDPFDMKRAAGVGLRVYLPMFGLLGLDYGWGFDSLGGRPVNRTGEFTFTIGGNISGW